MANDLRSQYRATKISSLKKAVDKDDAMVGVMSNEYLNLEDGKTMKIRLFPAHPGEEQFYVPRKCYWLSFVNSDGDVKRGTVLDSILHGGTKMDLVDEYVKFAKKKYGKDADKMEALTGTGLNSNSLNPQYSWLCYADEVREGEDLHAKVWEFKKMVRDLLNKLAFSEDDDEPIEVDPFTDVDDGLVLAVKYNKKPNKKKGENYYEVDFAKKAKQPYARPLTDDELESFASLKPISEVTPKYSMRDYERALEGLQNWDEENDFNLFDDDDWLDVVEKVKAQYEESDSDDEDEKPKKKTTAKKAPAKKVVEEEVEEPEEDEDTDDEDAEEPEEEEATEADIFDGMDRTELKKYNKENDLGITVKKSMSDDELRNAVREAAAKKNDADDDEDTAEADDEDDSEEEAPAAGKVTLADIRKKLAGKK